MRNETRAAFDGYLHQQARLNNLSTRAVATKFNVAPSVQQNLETAIQESSDFLKKINIIGVDEQKGEALLLGVAGTIASRTNTDEHARSPKNVAGLTRDSYECEKTNFDTAIPYALLDQWAKFPDFQARLSGSIAHRQGLDRIMIGFNGTSVAAATNSTTNPLLQDVNKGWLQKMRDGAEDRVITEGAASGKVTIGSTGDYKTLDGLVFDAVQLLDPWHRNRDDLVVIVPRSMLHARFLSAVEKGGDSNVEDVAADAIMQRTRIGGLPYVDAPFFPDGTVMVTTLANLSIYYQNERRRRHIKDEPERDRIADYQSSNEAYVIEDFGLAALVENIEAA